MKKKLFLLTFALFVVSASFAQQITKFGVVDTTKVYNAYFKNSSAIKNYDSKREAFQREIEKLTDELRGLQNQKLEAQRANNLASVTRLEAEITKKTDFLREYTNAKNIELESMKRNLQTSDEFYKKLYATIGRIAENGGYSMILSLQQSMGILWYSNSVDVTEQVIQALGL